MNHRTTIFLKIAIFIIGIATLALCVFLLPWLAERSAEMNPEYAHLKNSVLIGLYVTAIPFFFALYQAFILLNYIESNHAFSARSVKALNGIKYCAITITLLYILGSFWLLSQNALHPGIALIGLTIIFASVVITLFTAVLQTLLRSAIEIKSENELTV